jgi:hypothetical protein
MRRWFKQALKISKQARQRVSKAAEKQDKQNDKSRK